MPLNFMTADSAPRPPEAEIPLPHDERDRWRRPYRVGPWRVATAALLLLLTSYVLISAVIIALAGELPYATGCVAVAAAVTVLALRLLRVGVWVSGRGLRQVSLLRTATLAWPEVAAVRTTQQPVKWLGLPRTVQGQALLVVRVRDGQPLRPVVTDHNSDFVTRPGAFDRAADVIEAWAAESRYQAWSTPQS